MKTLKKFKNSKLENSAMQMVNGGAGTPFGQECVACSFLNVPSGYEYNGTFGLCCRPKRLV